jgi:hypothetical protein
LAVSAVEVKLPRQRRGRTDAIDPEETFPLGKVAGVGAAIRQRIDAAKKNWGSQ